MAQSNFEIIETISEGLTTKVYKARQPSLDRVVLLKRLHKHLAGNAELVQRFEREAKACARLRSEHIVQVYDLEEHDGSPTIVIEYVEGVALDELLAKEPKQSEEFALNVAQGVLKALVVAHGAGVVHRDIKPANILIAKNGILKVADFGLASLAAAPSLTVEGAVIGTPAYMSPEQASGEQASAASDLFSLGTTLIEILTGQKLFYGATYAECLNKILHFKPEMLDRFGDMISPRTLSFLKRLMMPKEGDRFASAEKALRFISEGKEVPDETFWRKRKHLQYVGLAAALVLVVVLVVSVFRPGSEQPVLESQALSTSALQSSADRLRDSSAQNVGQIPKADLLTDRPPGKSLSDKSTDPLNGTRREAVDSMTPSSAVRVADSGYLQISCNPWAKVYLGNEYVGTTPIAHTLKVPAGRHTLTFNNPSFSPLVRTVDIRRNEQAGVEADFLENTGFIFVSVVPWAEVYIDDQYRDTTPLRRPLIVSSGTRRVRLHNPAFEDIVTSTAVSPNDTTRLVFSFAGQSKK